MRRQIVALAVLFSVAVGNAWGQVQYTVTDLGALPSVWQAATGINASGQVVGYGVGSGTGQALSYSNGTVTDLGTLPGGTWSNAGGVNASGQVVGGGH